MRTNCPDCGLTYDDAERLTICPHNNLMSPGDTGRKNMAIMLLGKKVRLRHLPESDAGEVIAISFSGMIAVRGLGGSYDPSLFVVVE